MRPAALSKIGLRSPALRGMSRFLITKSTEPVGSMRTPVSGLTKRDEEPAGPRRRVKSPLRDLIAVSLRAQPALGVELGRR